MARTQDTKVYFLAWYKEVFGFSDEAARALYDDQLLRSKLTLSELTDQTIDNIIKDVAVAVEAAAGPAVAVAVDVVVCRVPSGLFPKRKLTR